VKYKSENDSINLLSININTYVYKEKDFFNFWITLKCIGWKINV